MASLTRSSDTLTPEKVLDFQAEHYIKGRKEEVMKLSASDSKAFIATYSKVWDKPGSDLNQMKALAESVFQEKLIKLQTLPFFHDPQVCASSLKKKIDPKFHQLLEKYPELIHSFCVTHGLEDKDLEGLQATKEALVEGLTAKAPKIYAKVQELKEAMGEEDFQMAYAHLYKQDDPILQKFDDKFEKTFPQNVCALKCIRAMDSKTESMDGKKILSKSVDFAKHRETIFRSLTEGQLKQAIQYFEQYSKSEQFDLSAPGAKTFLALGCRLDQYYRAGRDGNQCDVLEAYGSSYYNYTFSEVQKYILSKLREAWVLASIKVLESVVSDTIKNNPAPSQRKNSFDFNEELMDEKKILSKIVNFAKHREKIFGSLTEGQLKQAIQYFEQYSKSDQFDLSAPGAKTFLALGYRLDQYFREGRDGIAMDALEAYGSSCYTHTFSEVQKNILSKLREDWVLASTKALESVISDTIKNNPAPSQRKNSFDFNKELTELSQERTSMTLPQGKTDVTVRFSTDYHRYDEMILSDQDSCVSFPGDYGSTVKAAGHLVESLKALTKGCKDPHKNLVFILQEKVCQNPEKLATHELINKQLENSTEIPQVYGFLMLTPNTLSRAVIKENQDQFRVEYRCQLSTNNPRNLEAAAKKYDYKIIYELKYDNNKNSWFIEPPVLVEQSLTASQREFNDKYKPKPVSVQSDLIYKPGAAASSVKKDMSVENKDGS